MSIYLVYVCLIFVPAACQVVTTMSLRGDRTSVFTFQSTVHSSHVLTRLNDQRLSDVLCDVTLVAGGRAFRAHCSVLASCSDYFHSRILNHTSPSLVLTLPDQVRVIYKLHCGFVSNGTLYSESVLPCCP